MTNIKATSSPEKAEKIETIIEDRFEKSEEFVARNKKIFGIIIGLILVAAAAFMFYKYSNNQKNTEAQNEIFGAVYYFEADSLDKALKGDGKSLGLLEIAEEYKSTKAGNLANFYVGVIYLKQGKFEDAIEYLKSFSSDDLFLQARVYALTGDAYLEQKQLEEAIRHYKKAAEHHPNDAFTPKYLMKLALAQELNNDFSGAVESYNKIIENHFKSSEVVEAKKLKAVVEMKATSAK